MSWLTNLVSKNSTNTPTTAQDKSNNNLYISVDPTRVCFLHIDEKVTPNKIISWQEFPLGPIEDLAAGEPVRDMFGSLTKFFTSHKEVFDNVLDVAVSLPAEGVFFRNIEVPKVADADKQKLILAEIKKTLPVDFAQVLFAQNDLGEKHDNMSSYFCVGIQKMLFENYKNLFTQFKLNPYFEIEVFSLARLVQQDKVPKLIVQVGRINTFLIFLEGQIIQDIKSIEMGQNDLNKEMNKNLGLSFDQAEILKENFGKLKDSNRMGANILDEFLKEFDQKLAKAITLHILEYEKNQNTEIKEVILSGSIISTKLKKVLHDEFDAELKIDYVTEENFKEFVAENFLLNELKRYAQCFGLALRNK